MAAAQQTTAPINMAAAGPFSESEPKMTTSIKEAVKIVAIVTPDIGLLELPTRPAIYPATAENKNPAMTINMAIKPVTATSCISLK